MLEAPSIFLTVKSDALYIVYHPPASIRIDISNPQKNEAAGQITKYDQTYVTKTCHHSKYRDKKITFQIL